VENVRKCYHAHWIVHERNIPLAVGVSEESIQCIKNAGAGVAQSV
jgi:hypothetical protein